MPLLSIFHEQHKKNLQQSWISSVIMGPRKRKRLLTGLTLVIIAILGIQYTGYNELDVPDVHNVYYNPSLPNDRFGRAKFSGLQTFSPNFQFRRKQSAIIKRGPSRHLQEQIHVQENEPVELVPNMSLRIQNSNMQGDDSKHLPHRTKHDKSLGGFKEKDDERRKETFKEEIGEQSEIKSKPDGSIIITVFPAYKIPSSFLGEPSCPACLGTSMCDEFYEGNINIFSTLPQQSQSGGVYSGIWNGCGVILRKIDGVEGRAFEQFLCANGSGEVDRQHCDVGIAALEGVISRKDAGITPHQLRSSILPEDENPLSLINPATCANDRILERMEHLYHIHHLKSHQHSSKKAMLSTSLLLDPTPVVLKFIEAEVPSLLPYFPQLFGVCGQVAVLKEEGIPLINFLPETWENRVNVSIELLYFIDDLWNASPDWGFLFLDFNYSSFVVLPNGKLQMTQPDKLLIVDKRHLTAVPGDIDAKGIMQPPCNKQCIATFLYQLQQTHRSHCNFSLNPEQFMYMMAAQRLLSDLFTTKLVYMFSDDRYVDENHPGGLLYDVPLEIDGKLAELLYECTIESQGGARMHSAKMLRRLLEIVRRGFQYKRMKKRANETKKDAEEK